MNMADLLNYPANFAYFANCSNVGRGWWWICQVVSTQIRLLLQKLIGKNCSWKFCLGWRQTKRRLQLSVVLRSLLISLFFSPLRLFLTLLLFWLVTIWLLLLMFCICSENLVDHVVLLTTKVILDLVLVHLVVALSLFLLLLLLLLFCFLKR